MRKTTAKYSASVLLWLLIISPVALVLAIEKKHPDFENRQDHFRPGGPMWDLAMFMSSHCFVVIWLGAVLVALAIWRWRRTAIVCRVLLGMMALASAVATLVVAARYEVYYVLVDIRLSWWLSVKGIDQW